MFYYTSANIMALGVNGSQALLRLSSFNKPLNPQQPFRPLHGHNSLLIVTSLAVPFETGLFLLKGLQASQTLRGSQPPCMAL